MSPIPALDVVRRPEAAAALLDPVRQQLLSHLAEPDSATGLARRLQLPRQRVNYHLRALESANGVKKDAAETMGLTQRALSYYLAKHRIS